MDRCYRLAALIAAGETLDRKRVAKELGTTEANADRHVQAIIKRMQVEEFSGKDGITCVRASKTSGKKIGAPTVVAACFGASLAQLFEGTPFEQHLRDVVAHILEGVRDVPKFKDRDRQFLFISRGGERALGKDRGALLAEVVDAILERQVLRVSYKRFRGESKKVYVKPVSLAVHQHQLYLLGLTETGLENLRFSRITAVFATKETFVYPNPDEYAPRAWFRNSIGIFIHDDTGKDISVQKVKIRLDRRWASYVETHRWHESQRHAVDENGVLLELTVRTCPELEALVLGFGGDAEVLEPSSLRERIAKHVAAMGARYGEPARSAPKRRRAAV
jgi:predicted DNA-binding transcriptional regulator YafY